MSRTITFNDLRKFKDKLPHGSIRKISEELGLEVETVRNYFGGYNYKEGKSIGVHMEPGPDGGIVVLDDTTIFDKALSILGLEDYPVYKEVEVEEEKERTE
ncbi:MAG: DNA-binding protein [Dysgonamonadaceae bacterium]|jgi:hypothetical protein|nr:DNA-binding protein [Dysgonamonadaceae bacterium]MDD3727403.1 DNA-binding protein [Dysgonamonadaceae bacterium]MDD4246523.1 DNA-binding protein [Dysgonamonadaceae bacterium]MDD4605727.1 DNA-binding protein [Dysgonamonadaceae bacterium]HUI32392.1 hypothetical protein [Dysgonamonadaceae bacterium]